MTTPQEAAASSPPPKSTDSVGSGAGAAAAALSAARSWKEKAKEKAHLVPHRKGHALDQIAGTYRVEGHKKALLHGNLHIKIIKCEGLKNMDCTCVCAPTCLVNDVCKLLHCGHVEETSSNPV